MSQEEREHQYPGKHITVRYNLKRCIHAAECVRGLPAVFDGSRKPWVTPDAASADEIAEVIMRCPSGALHFTRHDGGAEETPPAENRVILMPNGPLYVRGDITLVRSNGEVVAKDVRLALCRCGASKNKPFCDNTHKAIGFRDGGLHAGEQGEQSEEMAVGGALRIELIENGPLHVEGQTEIRTARGQVLYRGSDTWLCRCGGSQNKPFCDGTHNTNGFSDARSE